MFKFMDKAITLSHKRLDMVKSVQTHPASKNVVWANGKSHCRNKVNKSNPDPAVVPAEDRGPELQHSAKTMAISAVTAPSQTDVNSDHCTVATFWENLVKVMFC